MVRHRLTKRLRNYRTLEHVPTPTPYHHITKHLFTAVPFTSSIMYQEKIARHTKRQKTQFEETKKVSEPDTAGMLKLPDREFKGTMMNM